jgi:hypothetical protein
MPADDLRARIARALAPSGWLREDGLPASVDAVLAALVEDPGSLPDRMSDAIDNAIISGDDYNPVKAAEAAMSVRDELVAHLSARVAAAEARVVHAEEGAQLSSERLANVRQEYQAELDRTVEQAGNHIGDALRRLEEAEAELAALKAAVAEALDCWPTLNALRKLRAALAFSGKKKPAPTEAPVL